VFTIFDGMTIPNREGTKTDGIGQMKQGRKNDAEGKEAEGRRQKE
jgi:hypothetical protein